MHPIQTFIITQLSENDRLRYSDMKPKSMEPGQFMYHLKQLIGTGLVIKDGATYSLSPLGTQFIDRLNDDKLEPFSYPRVAAALLYISSNKGLLMAKRQKHPGLGLAGFILADIPINYTPPLTSYAESIFRGRTANDTSFTNAAMGYIRVTEGDALIANMLCHILVARGPSFTPKDTSLVWQSEIDRSKVISSTWQVLNDVNRHSNYFFFEHSLSVDNTHRDTQI